MIVGSIRPLEAKDISACVPMAIESFGDDYTKDQFNTIEEEFKAAFDNEWWGRPNYYVFESEGQILGMGGYALSWLDWGVYEMFWSCVKNGYKNQGIGKALVAHREKEIIKEASGIKFKRDITILFSCTQTVVEYHKKNGYKVLINKASGKEVIMGKTFLTPTNG